MLSELVSLARPAGGTVGIPGLGAFWLYDTRELLAEVTIDYHGQEDDHVFALGLGAYYPFLRGNATPYLGGGLRYAWSQFGHVETSRGLQARAALGLLFGRLSTVQLRAELGYFVNLYRDREYAIYPVGYWDGTSYVSTPAAEPRRVVAHGPMLGVGIGF